MAATMTPAQILQAIREAIYGRDVREAIAQGIEYGVDTVTGAVRYNTVQSLADADRVQARENIKAAGKIMIASEYSATGRYGVGDYCLHDGKLWRCITAITTNTEWDGDAHWLQVQLAEDTLNNPRNVASVAETQEYLGLA